MLVLTYDTKIVITAIRELAPDVGLPAILFLGIRHVVFEGENIVGLLL